jgi:DNA segregation ATPase FtsK/SpoIIIE-like protein
MAEQPVDSATLRLAGKLFRILRQTFLNRGLYQQRQDGSLREVEWVGWTLWLEQRAFAFVLDTGTLPVSIERLCDEKVIHQVSTALAGRRVEVVNHRGVAWLLAMDLPPLAEPQPRRTLPKAVDLDLSQRPPGEYLVGLGVGRDGPVWLSLEKACHIMVGGSSDSGKSAFLRSLLYQLLLLPEPIEILLIDMEGRTFSAFEGLPRVRFPVAEDVESATRLTAWLLDEMERRGRLFDATGHHPEKLSEYHQVSGVERLPWIVAVFDEFTALLDAAGQRSELYRHVGQLAMRSRKYGVTLVFAGQDFKSDLVNSRITNQVRTRVTHRCATRQQSESILGQGGAEQLGVQGRALVSLHCQVQEVQGFWVAKEQVLALHEQGSETGTVSLLTDLEREMVRYAVEELNGAFSVTALFDQFRGQIGKEQLITLAQSWELRGWLTEMKQRSQSRRVTRSLLAVIEGNEEPQGA